MYAYLNSLNKTAARNACRCALLFIALGIQFVAGAAGAEQPSPFALPEPAGHKDPATKTTPARAADSAFNLPDAPGTATGQQKTPQASPFALPETPAGTPAPGQTAGGQASTDAETLFNQGTELARQGQFAEADSLLRQVLAIDPRHVRAMNNIGLIQRRLGKNEEALQNYQQAIAADATYALTYKNMGILLDQMKDFPAALKAYEGYLRTAPNAADAKAIRERSEWLAAEVAKTKKQRQQDAK